MIETILIDPGIEVMLIDEPVTTLEPEPVAELLT